MSATLVTDTPRPIGERVVGPIGFGCWRFTNQSVDDATRLVEAAVDVGMTLIDTADVYGLDFGGTGFGTNEEILGKVLAASPSLRGRIVLATKGGIIPPRPYDSSPGYIRQACDDSLRRLGVDHIDLYQIHRPDPFTHPEALAGVLTELHHAGKIAAVGVSNHRPDQTDALQAHLPFPIATDQPEFSLAHLDPLTDGTLDRCLRLGVTPLAWSPLGGGRLATGEGLDPILVSLLDEMAEREGVTRATIAVAFVLAHPAAPVAIIGTQKIDRLIELAQAARVTLSRDDVYRLVAAAGLPLP